MAAAHGRKAHGGQGGRPMAALLDLLGRRWALRALWELRGGAISFRGLQLACGAISPTVLSKRLSELREAGLVEATPAGFVLSGSGAALLQALAPLDAFAQGWARPGARAKTRTARPTRAP